ncbi:MAG TPA: AmmeMemoRadiSam system protein B [Candidatus Bipolaricaulota bacterium]|nr:AmmeMemoRadiSam system protein B [Candidatus Bipolaricaulota bacterium]
MTIRKIFLIFLIPAAVAAGMFFVFLSGAEIKNHVTADETEQPVQEILSGQIIKAELNPDYLYPALLFAESVEIKQYGLIKGAIVTHHDLAIRMTAENLYRISRNQKVDRLILISPNHSDIGLSQAIGSLAEYDTIFGRLSQDESILEDLRSAGLLSYDYENIKNEHGINYIVPLIKYYFPEAKVAALSLSSKHDLKQDLKLSNALSKYLDEANTVLIASIDFSHYLSTSSANQNDSKTLEAIKALDFDFLSTFNNDFFDSPAALSTLMSSLDLAKATNDIILGHANSSDFVGHELNSSTGYFSILFSK